jgi:hypothetical protein
VAPPTTYLTAPLGPDGLPDYVGYLQARARAGVTPENNAAVLIWKATWPGDLQPKHYQVLCDALGMPVPSGKDSLVSPNDESWLQPIRDALSASSADGEPALQAEDVVQLAQVTPWTSEQLPLLATWVQQNEAALNLLVEGAHRPKYYSPSPSLLQGNDTSLIEMLLPQASGIRNAARGLVMRAMWHLGEGRPMEAWQDLSATFLFARHVSTGASLVEQLVAIAIESMACSGTQTLLHHAQLSPEQLALIQAELNALPGLPRMSDAIDEGERLMYLDSVMRLASGKTNILDLQGTSAPGVVASTRIDWNHILQKGNVWYDRLVEVASLPRAERLIAMTRFDQQLAELTDTKTPTRILGSVVSRRVRSDVMADIMLSLFLPAVGSAVNAEERVAVAFEMTRIAAALAAYRAANQEYPADLVALVPDFLPAVPVDLYAEKAFFYECRANGYLLYSVYENGVDDCGTDFGGEIVQGEWVTSGSEPVNRDATDFVVRMPRPDMAPVVPRVEAGMCTEQDEVSATP